VEGFGLTQLSAQLVAADLGQQRGTVLITFSAAHEHQALVEVDILNPEFTTLRHAQPAAVDHSGHDLREAAHGRQ
jgi:hypothetical protein